MDDVDKASSLRHRGIANKLPNDDITNDVITEWVYPAAPPNSPVDGLRSREYTVLIDPRTSKETLSWKSPAIPYAEYIEVIEQKPSQEVTLGTVLSETLAPLNVVSNLIYLGLLFGNAKSVVSPPFMFAVGQLSENCKYWTSHSPT
jgi:hypothetical protein